MNASIAIQVLPQVHNRQKTIAIVDEVIEYIKQSGLHYQVGAFETTIEGDYDVLMEILKQCQLIACEAGAPSVLSYAKIMFISEGSLLSIDEKTKKHQ